jgi:hypothetical protein
MYSTERRAISDVADKATIKWLETQGFTFIRNATDHEDRKEHWDYLFADANTEKKFSFKSRPPGRFSDINLETAPVDERAVECDYHAWNIGGKFYLASHVQVASWPFSKPIPTGDGTYVSYLPPSSCTFLSKS